MMNSKMKAIETNYNGFRFRSRLEARTAVFLHEAKIPYIYEPEGFIFEDGTTYLPDFYLPNQNAFLECKGVMTEKDEHKIEQLAKYSGKYVVIIYSDLSFYLGEWVDNLHDYFPFEEERGGIIEQESWLCKCKKCGKKYFGDMNGAWDCKCCGYYDGDAGFEVLAHGDHELQGYDDYPPIIKAKRARFEFGERGAE